MALLNHAKKELSAKIVYYGPGLSGKTTNLEWIHRKLAPDKRGKLISLETKTDRTLFFDFLPVQIGEISGFRTRFNVYTVPGQIFYNETRRMVLKGVDGIVFVADSQKEMANENLENLKNLAENLRSIGKELSKIPLVIQFNKRDLSNILSVEEMNRLLNAPGLPFFEAVAVKGEGVLTTLTRITRVVADHLRQTLFASPLQNASEGKPTSETEPATQPETPRSFADSLGRPTEQDRPAFLSSQPEPRGARQTAEVKVRSRENVITPHFIETFHGKEETSYPGANLASAGAQPGVAPSLGAKEIKEIPSLGDLGDPPEVRPFQQTNSTPPSQGVPRPREVVTPVTPRVVPPSKEPSKPDASEATSKGYWVDPSVVTVSAEQVSSSKAPKTVALRFGDPEREAGHQVRIPVALRVRGSNEIISFHVVIRVEQESDSD